MAPKKVKTIDREEETQVSGTRELGKQRVQGSSFLSVRGESVGPAVWRVCESPNAMNIRVLGRVLG